MTRGNVSQSIKLCGAKCKTGTQCSKFK